jgi:hypothetical protein
MVGFCFVTYTPIQIEIVADDETDKLCQPNASGP